MDCSPSSSNSESAEPDTDSQSQRRRKAIRSIISSFPKGNLMVSRVGEDVVDCKRARRSDEDNSDIRDEARQALLNEAKRGAARSEKIGPQGW